MNLDNLDYLPIPDSSSQSLARPAPAPFLSPRHVSPGPHHITPGPRLKSPSPCHVSTPSPSPRPSHTHSQAYTLCPCPQPCLPHPQPCLPRLQPCLPQPRLPLQQPCLCFMCKPRPGPRLRLVPRPYLCLRHSLQRDSDPSLPSIMAPGGLSISGFMSYLSSFFPPAFHPWLGLVLVGMSESIPKGGVSVMSCVPCFEVLSCLSLGPCFTSCDSHMSRCLPCL